MDVLHIVPEDLESIFREIVDEAFSSSDASPEARAYVTQLMLGRYRMDSSTFPEDELLHYRTGPKLTLLYSEAALKEHATERREKFREVGDLALVLAGMYPESTTRIHSPLDLAQVADLGEAGYRRADEHTRPSGGVLYEMGTRFRDYVASMQSILAVHSPEGIIALFERYTLTGSDAVAKRLFMQGMPMKKPTPEN